MEYADRTTETCADCRHYRPPTPSEVALCVVKPKHPVKAYVTHWCERYSPASLPQSEPEPALPTPPPVVITDQRISRQVMFMEIAATVAKRSTCFRLNVGCVLTANNRLLSIGYNGAPSGEPHCTGNTCPGRSVCTLTIHAERNALNRTPSPPTEAYITDSPCLACAEDLVAAGVRTVYFGTPYRNTDPLIYLASEKVAVYQIAPCGYIIEWWSKEIMQ